jgi:hypothetical protein
MINKTLRLTPGIEFRAGELTPLASITDFARD